MEDIMITRVKDVRKSLGLNQTDFAKHIGLTQTAYSMIESGIRPLSDKHIKVICSEFGVNEHWIRKGVGEMFLSSPYEKEFMDIFKNLTPESKDFLLKMSKELLNTQEKLLKTKSKESK